MTSKVISDFGLYNEVWKKEDRKKWILYLGICGFLMLGLGCLYNLIWTLNKTGVIEDQLRVESLAAEKLILPIPLRDESIEEYPRPFGMAFKEPVPSSFRASSTTEKITTISYPQLGRYRDNYQPRNIQDILKYTEPILKTKSYDGINMNGNQYTKSNFDHHSMSRSRYIGPPMIHFGLHQQPTNHDPFYAYKPQDPSDINLMATASVRFAPPPWKNMNKNLPHFPYNMKESEHPLKSDFVKHKFGKPIIVTLNIFPMTERDKGLLNSNYQGPISLLGKMVATREFEGKFGSNMIVRFNYFPDALDAYNHGREEGVKK